MSLNQSVVLWQGRRGIQKAAYFGKRRSPYYGKNSSNKQREMSVHHYFKTWRSVNRKMSRTLKVSLSAVAKTIKWYDETGSREDRHRKGTPRVTSAAEDTFIRVTSLRNYSPNKCNRHISTSTIQRRPRESGLHGQISVKKPLLKDTNKKKKFSLGQETQAMDVSPMKICPLVWWVQIWDF